jgi:uncharacterized damage-inducible protein DinB
MNADLVVLVKSALIEGLEHLLAAVRQLSEPLGEAAFWRKPIVPGNSVGHLVLHLAGNLNHFVGAQLGGTGYVRDRDREFNEARPPTKAEALAGLDRAVAVFRQVLTGLDPQQLAAPHAEARFGPVLHALVHLVAHFALHRGQMSYIVRLLDGADNVTGPRPSAPS